MEGISSYSLQHNPVGSLLRILLSKPCGTLDEAFTLNLETFSLLLPDEAKHKLFNATMSSSAFVLTNYHLSRLSPEITISIIICVVIASAMSMLLMKNRRLPPMNVDSMLETIVVFMKGGGAPEFFYSNMKKLGPVYRLRLPEVFPWIVVCDSALAKTIFDNEHEKPNLYQRFNGANNGSNTIASAHTSDPAWNMSRKGMSPAFSMAHVCSSLPLMYAKIDVFKAILKERELDGTTFDVAPMMIHMTMDFICAAMFNVDHGTMRSSSSEGRHLIKILNILLKEYGLKQMFNPFRFLMFWNAEVRQAKVASVVLDDAQRKLLADYRLKKSPEEILKDTSLIGHLVRSPYKSDKERCADMTMLLVAGLDSTAYTISWIIIEIAKNPDVLAKMKKEIGSIVTTDENITVKQLNDMPYLDCVIKEGMRLWPVAAAGALRVTSKDIKYGAYNIPKGSTVHMPFYAIHRHGIQNPEGFDPERWAPDAVDAEKMKELYMPFALGKRNCVGQNLAKLEIKLILATLYKSFSFELTSEVVADYFLTLKPVNAHMKVLSAKC